MGRPLNGPGSEQSSGQGKTPCSHSTCFCASSPAPPPERPQGESSPACGDAVALDKGGGRRDRAESTSPRAEGERRGGEIWHWDRRGREKVMRERNCWLLTTVTKSQKSWGPHSNLPRLAKTKPIPRIPRLGICRNGQGWCLPELPGKEEEKVKKGPVSRELWF